MRILGASRDVPRKKIRLVAKELHSSAINLYEEGRGAAAHKTRWSLVTNAGDMATRTFVVDSLPRLHENETIEIDAGEAERIYDPQIAPVGAGALKVWRALWRDWFDALDDEECGGVIDTYLGEGVAALTGMGPGLTPAGDDFIAGWLTAHRASGLPVSRKAIRHFWNAWKVKPDTTWFSTWMIVDAVRGKIWMRGKELLRAMESGDARGVRNALDAIAEWGHTSGTAWLAGLGAGFITILPTASHRVGDTAEGSW